MKRGYESNLPKKEIATSIDSDFSYKRPKAMLPASHAAPKQVSKMPNAVLRRAAAMSGEIAGLSRVSCAPLLTPHSAIPSHAKAGDPKNTSGVNAEPIRNAPMRTGNP